MHAAVQISKLWLIEGRRWITNYHVASCAFSSYPCCVRIEVELRVRIRSLLKWSVHIRRFSTISYETGFRSCIITRRVTALMSCKDASSLRSHFTSQGALWNTKSTFFTEKIPRAVIGLVGTHKWMWNDNDVRRLSVHFVLDVTTELDVNKDGHSRAENVSLKLIS